MSICTECGTVMHRDDAELHVCNASEIPEKGKPIPKGKTKAEVV